MIKNKILFFAIDKKDIFFLKRISSTFKKNSINYLAVMDYRLKEDLTNLGYDLIFPELEMDRDNLYGDIDATSLDMAANWFKVDMDGKRNDISLYDDFSVAESMTWKFSYFFADAIKAIKETKYIIDKVKPSEIRFIAHRYKAQKDIIRNEGESFYEEIISFISKDCGITYTRLCALTVFEIIESSKAYISDKIRQISRILCLKYKKKSNFLLSNNKNNILLCSKNLDNTDKDLFKKIGENGKVFTLKNIFFDTSKTYFTSLNLPDYCNKDNLDSLKNARKFFKKVFSETKYFLTENKTMVFEDINIFRVWQGRFQHTFENTFPEAFFYRALFKDLLFLNKIRLIVLNNDVCFPEKMFVYIAKELGIRSLVIQHGNVTHPIAFLPVSADKIAVWGERDRKWFIEKGVISNKIEITGCLKFQKPCLKSKEAFFYAKGLEIHKRLITYTMDYSRRGVLFANYHLLLHNQIDIIKNLKDALNDVTDVQLLVKLHPDDPYFDFLKRKSLKIFNDNKNLKIIRDIETREVLAYSDLLISRISSTILEAVLLSKPVLIYNPTYRPDVMSYAKDGFLKEINNFEDLKKCVSLDNYSPFLVKDKSLLNEYIKFDNSLNNMCRLVEGLLN